jgi:TolB-like protein
MSRFLSELKRRNVIRMGGLYLVGAWLITQVAATLLPVFGAPEWVMKVLVGLLALGFLAALVFSWIYELTPDGLKRDGEVAAAQSIAPQTARRMDRMLLVVMALALGYFAVDKFVLSPERVATAPGSTAASADPNSPADAGTDSKANANAAATDEPEAKPIVRGIGVLPFDNLSPDPDNAFFAGGVYEEVLTKLSRIGELRVISRTSMERIAKEDLEVGTIGQRLGVSHVLEGSVRKAGDQIRVTVQLIEAATDAHIWAENYDRKLDDVFAIQSEIALAIADQLKLTLSPELQANLSERPTQNQAAYALYLRALEEGRTWRGSDGFKSMIELLEPAVAADPDFLQAKVLLAGAYGRMKWTNRDPDGSFAEKARHMVAEIVRRWPDHPQSRIAQGQLLYNLERDSAGALTHFEAARTQLPNDSQLLQSLGASLKRLGRAREFLAVTRQALALDPESPAVIGEVLFALLQNEQLDEAAELAETAQARFPNDQIIPAAALRIKLARDQDVGAVAEGSLLWLGRRDHAGVARFVRGDIDALSRPIEIPWIMLALERAELLRMASRPADAEALIKQTEDRMRARLEQPSNRDIDAVAAAWFAQTGDVEQAREHLGRAKAATPNDDYLDRFAGDWPISMAERLLGDPEAAWLRMQPYAHDSALLGRGELLAFQKYYGQLFGESPSYRAYMAKIDGEKR